MNRQDLVRAARSAAPISLLMIVALTLAGCANIGGAQQPGAATSPGTTNTPLAATAAVTEAPASAPAATGVPLEPVGPAALRAVENLQFGPILVDEKGMTLYLFTKDQPDTSNCYDKCAQAWPPLLTKGEPVAKDAADEKLLGSTSRKDGTLQVTYNGWPLYYYVKDQKPGDVTGQEVGGVWYLVSPQGEKIEAAETAAPTSASNAPEPKTVSVTIKGFSFGQALTVPVGTTVVWTNQDDMAHTVTAGDGSFDSGELAKGETFQFTFEKEGAFDYSCAIHPSMKGVVTVTK